MQLSMWSRKRPLLREYEREASPCAKKPVTGLSAPLGGWEADGSEGAAHVRPRSWGHSCPDACWNQQAAHVENTRHHLQQLSSWADTQYSVNKVLELFKSGQAPSHIFLPDSVNEKFRAFHRDIQQECGAEDKQHSWAVIEKREEVIMYGPYFPNYSSGEHSEDTVIGQTQELLESGAASDWKVYVFTVNSPCLARSTAPCMLNLVYKALEWRHLYGVKTHVGYVRCWGFKGNKETAFRDVTYQQVERMTQTEDYEGYVNAEWTADVNPLCEGLYAAAKRLLGSGHLDFPLSGPQGQDWRSHFKSVHGIFDDDPEEERKVLTQEANALIEAAGARLPERPARLGEYLEIGKEFALSGAFGPNVPEPLRDQMRVAFQRCWREMVQDKYAEFIRERLTEDFNRCTVELFIKEIVEFTKEYLEIGKIQFSENDLKVVTNNLSDAE
ncbi:uncharacterized protein LOC114850049 isoform X2 [Betta splendens]|uniref:Uncharacterized protein LOC114850049 isoform X2 n=1 Tax=Betta splendens TaxID=158456 RepID=A0A9W2XLK1_BETSP|nr:uncharacterized protein LOC114850049 isoform X2 [Betta splendens]